ncbi:uncharacterized protein OCT59_009092 [Rhizophagus irregularis]|uniref:Uncharacterized protein n=1 Tax=Rhizophagus irregularis (strain DAOM 197198w) TaxID=1432141 RepID=A0A015KJ70_RHIIW|nr:hypothetical protein RirG_003460 [Rhizophagus irregularis DAOM 197198w]UZO17751.1 hypothetical protein OCT59_009092 [Rhizophagus irregularis]GBC24433.1 hypothetical protein GLOIN_2v1805149 [Rhizophagus irregularis DAOM 181602=DAOM 197198]CAB4475077.1 unnamed protein product [Rhizophagus irregularis]
MRCESVAEDWEHIWSCDDNEKSEYEILIDTLVATEEKFKDLDEERHKIVRTLAKEIVDFMITPSNILIIGSQLRIRELTRGIFNNELYKLVIKNQNDKCWKKFGKVAI